MKTFFPLLIVCLCWTTITLAQEKHACETFNELESEITRYEGLKSKATSTHEKSGHDRMIQMLSTKAIDPLTKCAKEFKGGDIASKMHIVLKMGKLYYNAGRKEEAKEYFEECFFHEEAEKVTFGSQTVKEASEDWLKKYAPGYQESMHTEEAHSNTSGDQKQGGNVYEYNLPHQQFPEEIPPAGGSSVVTTSPTSPIIVQPTVQPQSQSPNVKVVEEKPLSNQSVVTSQEAPLVNPLANSNNSNSGSTTNVGNLDWGVQESTTYQNRTSNQPFVDQYGRPLSTSKIGKTTYKPINRGRSVQQRNPAPAPVKQNNPQPQRVITVEQQPIVQPQQQVITVQQPVQQQQQVITVQQPVQQQQQTTTPQPYPWEIYEQSLQQQSVIVNDYGVIYQNEPNLVDPNQAHQQNVRNTYNHQQQTQQQPYYQNQQTRQQNTQTSANVTSGNGNRRVYQQTDANGGERHVVTIKLRGQEERAIKEEAQKRKKRKFKISRRVGR